MSNKLQERNIQNCHDNCVWCEVHNSFWSRWKRIHLSFIGFRDLQCSTSSIIVPQDNNSPFIEGIWTLSMKNKNTVRVRGFYENLLKHCRNNTKNIKHVKPCKMLLHFLHIYQYKNVTDLVIWSLIHVMAVQIIGGWGIFMSIRGINPQ